MQLHIVIDSTGLKVSGEDENDVDDAQSGLSALARLEGSVLSGGGDGAYDKHKFRWALPPLSRQLIAPARSAVLSAFDPVLSQRDEAITQIRSSSRREWKQAVGYHQRSKAKVNMFRYKTIFGERIRGRKLVNQRTQVALNCKLLNRFAHLGLPKSIPISP